MKRKRKKLKPIFKLVILVCGFLLIKQFLQSPATTEQVSTSVRTPDPYSDVKKYSSQINNELAKFGLEEHTVTLVALMQQESRGQGGDPMQSSESAGLAPNTINEPSESIEQGVKHFKRMLEHGKKKDVDFPTILQSYNMGIGYINFIAKSGGTHTEALAKQFSKIQVEKNPSLYNCGGNKDNFRYPYCYGDYTYSSKVASNMDALSDSVPALGDKEQTGEGF